MDIASIALQNLVSPVILFFLLGIVAGVLKSSLTIPETLPEASPALYLTLALGITFPFNLVVGIPLYLGAARALTSASVDKATAIERPPPPTAGADRSAGPSRGAKHSEAR